jgi:hypothetical protein
MDLRSLWIVSDCAEQLNSLWCGSLHTLDIVDNVDKAALAAPNLAGSLARFAPAFAALAYSVTRLARRRFLALGVLWLNLA